MGVEGIEPPAGGVTSRKTGAAHFTIKLYTLIVGVYNYGLNSFLVFNLNYRNSYIF